MRDLDDIDREIIRLLLEDGRRPYSDIADHVGLSAPAVTDRIDRLCELGVIRSFTVDLDPTTLREGVSVLVELAVEPGYAESIGEAVDRLDRVEHRYVTADSRVFAHATIGPAGVDGLFETAVDIDRVRDVRVHLLSDSAWTPRIGAASLAIDCDECGNTVTSEGESARIDGKRYHFCCGSCLSNFRDRYDRLAEGT
ncbi:MAG: AsnC family transcriptional regulator [Halobacteriota archaeon]